MYGEGVTSGRLSVFLLAIVFGMAVVADSASAHGGGRGRGGFHGGARGVSGHSGHFHHFRGGGAVFIGVPFYYGPRYFYPAPYYYHYPYYPPAPTYYIEQPQPGYWHYCPQSGAYFPQVQICPGGWQLVPPQPRSGY